MGLRWFRFRRKAIWEQKGLPLVATRRQVQAIIDNVVASYEKQIQEINEVRRREAQTYSEALAEKDQIIHGLEEQTCANIERAVARWSKEYLQDKNYWMRLFDHVLSQPFGRQLWVEAVYRQIDQMPDHERLELFYEYLRSRGGELKIELKYPKKRVEEHLPALPQINDAQEASIPDLS